MRKFIVGNWKMNGAAQSLDEIANIAQMSRRYVAVDVAVCLPATLISRAADAVDDFAIGGQDCHMNEAGAHTGCVSAAMLVDAGASLTILGHSERRAAQHERDAEICAKAQAAYAAGLSAIVCVGETLDEREDGQALTIVLDQVAQSLPDNAASDWLSVAYEPVWAIGTGRVPQTSDVEDMHGAIRERLVARFGDDGQKMRILYGGSMNGDNAAELLAVANVDGGLIGGASLTASKFEPILAAAQALAE